MHVDIDGSPEEIVGFLDALRRFLCSAVCPQDTPGRATSLNLGVKAPLEDGVDLMLILPNDKKATLSIDPRDAKGKKAKVDGVPAWTSSDPNIASLAVADDGMSAVVTAGPLTDVDVPATAQVSVSADADLGEGVETLTGVLDVEVQGGDAVTLAVNAGPLEDA